MFKKLISFIFTVFVSVLAPLQSQAIGRVGNGGNVIVCLKPGSGECYGRDKHEAAFYDTFEAEIRYKIKPLSMYYYVVDPSSAADYAARLLQPIFKYDKEMANVLNSYIASFYADANFVAGIQLMPIPDTGISFIPYHSELRQLVVQREPISALDKRYVISKDLWDLMSNADQAHAMLHEVMYRYALEQKHEVESSEYIRYFNALVISGEVSKLTQKEFEDLAWSIFAKGHTPGKTN